MESKYIKAAEIKEELDIRPGHKIKLYGKETVVEGFYPTYNDALERWETIILTEGRGDPFERSLDVIEVLMEQPAEQPTIPQQGAVTAYNPLVTENELLKDLLTRIHKRAFEGRPTDLGMGTKQAAKLGEIEELIERYAPQCMIDEGGEKETIRPTCTRPNGCIDWGGCEKANGCKE